MLTIVGDIVMRPDQQRVLAILLLIIAVALLITSLWKLPGIELSAYNALRKNARSSDTSTRRSVYQISRKSKIVYQDALIN